MNTRYTCTAVMKYSLSAGGIAPIYFSDVYLAINELIWGALYKHLEIDNFFISHSLSGLSCIPIFTGVHCKKII